MDDVGIKKFQCFVSSLMNETFRIVLVTTIIRDKFFSLRHLSVRTVQRVIQKALRYAACHPAKKPILTERMMADRLEFCREYGHWTPNDWDGVCFSDEVKFLV